MAWCVEVLCWILMPKMHTKKRRLSLKPGQKSSTNQNGALRFNALPSCRHFIPPHGSWADKKKRKRSCMHVLFCLPSLLPSPPLLCFPSISSISAFSWNRSHYIMATVAHFDGPKILQYFKVSAGKKPKRLPTQVDKDTMERYVLWSDIQRAFPGVDYVVDPSSRRNFLMADENYQP